MLLLPYHLCCQKIKERETSSKVATPIYWADDGDQRALSIGCGGANIDTLDFLLGYVARFKDMNDRGKSYSQ